MFWSPTPRYLRVGELLLPGTKVRCLPVPWWRLPHNWYLFASPEAEVINDHCRIWRNEYGFSLQPQKGYYAVDGESEWVTLRWLDRVEEDSFVMRRNLCYRSGEWYAKNLRIL